MPLLLAALLCIAQAVMPMPAFAFTAQTPARVPEIGETVIEIIPPRLTYCIANATINKETKKKGYLLYDFFGNCIE